jgi:hypothetical protein
MAEPRADLDEVGRIVSALAHSSFQPILVGGMALVLLGSRRVTADFDFVVTHPRERLQSLVDVFYDSGFELASRLNSEGEITATIDNPRVAAIRIRLDAPDCVFFYQRQTGLRIDLLFDFPVPAATLAEHATRIKVRSNVFHVASETDLLNLKRIAHEKRGAVEDAQDLAFLEARQKRTS